MATIAKCFRANSLNQRAKLHAELRARFKRSIKDGDLPRNAEVDALFGYVQTVDFGLSVQAATGASRRELLRVVLSALESWPDVG